MTKIQDTINETYKNNGLEEINKGSFGRKFLCQREDADEFIKARDGSDGNNWALWGLQKEYLLRKKLNQQLPLWVPESKKYVENKDYKIASFEYVQKPHSIQESEIDVEIFNSIISDVVPFLKQLRRIKPEDEPEFNLIHNQSHLLGKKYSDGYNYFLDDRLSGGVYFNDEHYDEFKDFLSSCHNYIEDNYEVQRKSLIHGDLSNIQNILFNEDGVKAIIDWEISGWFDYLYDISGIEVSIVDTISSHPENELSVEEARKTYRSKLGLNQSEIKIMRRYKAKQLYISVEAAASHNVKDNRFEYLLRQLRNSLE
jgi:aminoglycoside phosphotransferase (APT) family kinase protein